HGRDGSVGEEGGVVRQEVDTAGAGGLGGVEHRVGVGDAVAVPLLEPDEIRPIGGDGEVVLRPTRLLPAAQVLLALHHRGVVLLRVLRPDRTQDERLSDQTRRCGAAGKRHTCTLIRPEGQRKRINPRGSPGQVRRATLRTASVTAARASNRTMSTCAATWPVAAAMKPSPSNRVCGGVSARDRPSWAPCATIWHPTLSSRALVTTTPMVVCARSAAVSNGAVSARAMSKRISPRPSSMSPKAL